MAKIAEDAPPSTKVPEYLEKYRDGIARIEADADSFAQAYSITIRVTPTRWQVW